MLKIWGRADGSNVIKAMWAIGELGIAHERIDWGGEFGGNDDPEYRRKNPNGREIGFARSIMLTDAGEEHDLYWDKGPVFDAITVHLDEIEETARGTTILATNAWSAVQAAEIKVRGCTFWGVQYHPEYSFGDIAAVMRRLKGPMIEQGLCHGDDDHARYIADLDALNRKPGDSALAWQHGITKAVSDFAVRTRELKNWIERQVVPARSKRGRA